MSIYLGSVLNKLVAGAQPDSNKAEQKPNAPKSVSLQFNNQGILESVSVVSGKETKTSVILKMDPCPHSDPNACRDWGRGGPSVVTIKCRKVYTLDVKQGLITWSVELNEKDNKDLKIESPILGGYVALKTPGQRNAAYYDQAGDMRDQIKAYLQSNPAISPKEKAELVKVVNQISMLIQ